MGKRLDGYTLETALEIAEAVNRAPTVPPEIRPNPGVVLEFDGSCVNTDEVVGDGILHVEQMNDRCFWARLDLPDGKAIVMWFNSSEKITLSAEWD
jgi:hypothetical protein